MNRTCCCIFLLVVLKVSAVPALADMRVLTLLEGENFWGGCVTDGRTMPFGEADFERDLYGDTRGNQAQPLLISDRGRYVWCEEPFKFTFKDGTLKVESRDCDIKTGKPGDTLREAFQYLSRAFFPSTGQIPDALLFVKPQYNTWIELIYDQREDRIRTYARDILGNGFPAGVLMIDDNWQDLHQLIPDALALGLMGYAYICPDMIGGRSREVVFPQGIWQGDDGSRMTGPCTKEIAAPLDRLPWYRLVSGTR